MRAESRAWRRRVHAFYAHVVDELDSHTRAIGELTTTSSETTSKAQCFSPTSSWRTLSRVSSCCRPKA